MTTAPTSELPDALRAELDLLDETLRQVLAEVAGPTVNAQVEALREAALAYHDDPTDEHVDAMLSLTASWDAQTRFETTRALTIYFLLANLAEEHHRARVVGELDAAGTVPESIDEAIAEIDERDGRAATKRLLTRLRVHPVLTAHPTEARRRAIVDALHRIALQLRRLDTTTSSSNVYDDVRLRLAEEIEVLWYTAPFRHERPSPVDEARRVIAVFDSTLFDVVPDIYRALDHALSPDDAGTRPPAFEPYLRWGSWVGGDRDGNPFVTADVTRTVAATHAAHVLAKLEEATRRAASSLTVSDRRAPAAPDVLAALHADTARFPEVAAHSQFEAPDQPHRRKLVLAAERLAATRADSDDGYDSPQEFAAELRMVQRSLAGAGCTRLAYGRLQDLLWQVETFGFHLASLEVRQHSSRHAQVLDEILPGSGRNLDAVAGLTEHGWPDDAPRREDLSDEAREALAVFEAMYDLQQRYGPDACFRYIVSFTQSAVDLLSVRALAGLALGDRVADLRLEVVPLFETRADLQAAPQTLAEYVELPAVASVLDTRGRTLEVMVGYSDSAKDVGVLAANLALHELQATLAAWAREKRLELTLFHGRGGSLGRGGGRVNRAIRGQAAGSVGGRFKITEQGEVIQARYRDDALARRHLEQVTNAVLVASSPSTERDNLGIAARFEDLRETLASASEGAYRGLVQTDGFAEFFAAATPYREISQLQIGSRPAHRTAAHDLSSLRAIPWTFAWAQCRVNLTAWYGVGSGLAAVAETEGGLDRLRAAYREWPFFNQLLENVEMALAKSERLIGLRFLELGGREDLSAAIVEEWDRTKQLVAEVTGHQVPLGDHPWLLTVIDRRRPYVDALSCIQLSELRRLRALDDPSALEPGPERDVVLLTISGISAGLQNTG